MSGGMSVGHPVDVPQDRKNEGEAVSYLCLKIVIRHKKRQEAMRRKTPKSMIISSFFGRPEKA